MVVVALALAVGGVVAFGPPAPGSAASNPVLDAWGRAQDAGSYRFTSDMVRTVTPSASIANVGRTSRSEQLHVAGRADLRASALALDLWVGGAGGPAGEPVLSLTHVDGRTFQRSPGGGWQEEGGAGVAVSGGDPMGYLSSARDVRLVESVHIGADAYDRYVFTLDGAVHAAAIADQVRQATTDSGQSAPATMVGPASSMHNMTGTGELWVDADGYPVRQSLALRFPEQDGEYVEARVDVDYAEFGAIHTIGVPEGSPRSPTTDLLGLVDGTWPIATALALVVLLLLVATLRRARRPIAVPGIAVALVISLLVTVPPPDAEAAEAGAALQPGAPDAPDPAVLASQALAAPAAPVDPHRSLLAAVPGSAGRVAVDSRPSTRATSPTDDSDDDGLSDDIEQTLGLDPDNEDTDGDGMGDGEEVNGFSAGGQDWYPDPFAFDSNHDGLADGLEFDIDGDDVPDDTDGDGIPNLFDGDNDGDDVADRIDLTPAGAVSTVFDADAPFRFAVDGMTATDPLPVYVDFQLRTADEDHLRLAMSPFDWPHDELGQIRDVDDGPADLRLVPMLEITLPDPAHQVPTADDLDALAVRLTEADTDGGRAAYVPLHLVTDEVTGAAMAFSGRMRYQAQASWGEDHEVRLVWGVAMDNDEVCDPDGEDPCGPDGYRYNQPQMIHRYDDAWRLTGLRVTEQHGAEVAIAYEDPSVDDDLRHPGPTWALSHVLDQRFLAASDDGNGGLDYEVTTETLGPDYDRHANGRGTDTAPHSLPNVFRVETAGYASFDRAVQATATTQTPRILSERFDAHWTGPDSLRPLLLTAYTRRTRTASADALGTGAPYFGAGPGRFQVNLAPDGAAAAPIDTIVGMQWTEYCGGGAGSPAWRACTAEETFANLEAQYAAIGLDNALFPTIDTGDAEIAGGQNMVMYLHAMSMQTGQTALVQRDPGDGSAAQDLTPYVGETDAVLDPVVAQALSTGAGGVVKVVANLAIFRELEKLDENLRALNNLGAGGIANRFLANLGTLGKTALGVGVFVGVAGLITATVFSQLGNTTATVALNLTLAAGQTIASIVAPIYSAVRLVRTGQLSAYTVLTGASEAVGVSRMAGILGLVVSAIAIWTIFGITASGLQAWSPEFNAALADGLAATYTVALLALLSATVIGLIVVAIIAVIDLLLLAICELGVDGLRAKATNEGCFTLAGAFTEFISKVGYSFDVMVDLERDDLIAVGAPVLRLADPSTGFTVGGHLDIDVPVTTTIAHADPDGADSWQMVPYLSFFSPANLRSSTFEYSLGAAPEELTATRGTMADEWADPTVDHGYLFKDLYGTSHGPQDVSYTGGFPLDEAGPNREIAVTFNSALAVPASECWTVVVAGALIPVCYKRTFSDSNSSELDPLYFDVLPATLDEFVHVPADLDALQWADTRPVGSYPSFPLLDDVDRDGVLSSRVGGLDPDDRRWDTDGDGLSDAHELELRQDGVAVSVGLADTDLDGLSDARELAVGTNPGVADTDNDGLTDAEEVQGWDIDVTGRWDLADETTRQVRVTSDPRHADADGDGVNDLAERDLATDGDTTNRVDENGQPYHPAVANVAPLAVHLRTDDVDGFLTPGQDVTVSTDVVATVPVEPGVLDLTTSPQLEGTFLPTRLGFDPSTFADSQSVTEQTTLVVGDGPSGPALLSADARTRLEDTGPGGTDFGVDSETAITGTRETALLDISPRSPDRADAFVMADAARDFPFPDASDVRNVPLPPTSGPVALDRDVEPHSPRRADLAYRSAVDPSIACNDAGECMTAWTHYDNCSTVSVDEITIVTLDADDHGTSGIEPGLYLRRQVPSDLVVRDADMTQLWFSSSNGGNDMEQGETRGPNAFGFPTPPAPFCGLADFHAYEIDGGSNEPAAGLRLRPVRWDSSTNRWVWLTSYYDLLASQGGTHSVYLASADYVAGSCGECILINVRLTIAPRQAYRVMGAVTNAAGARITPEIATPFDGATADVAVASDGTNFAVVSEERDTPFTGGPGSSAQPSGTRRVVLRVHDRTGALVGSRTVAAFAGSHSDKAWFDVEWTGSDWLVAYQHPGTRAITAVRFAALDSSPLLASGQLASDVTTVDPFYAFDLAHDPILDRTLLVYRDNGEDITAIVFDDDLVALIADIVVDRGLTPTASYNSLTGDWLVAAGLASGDAPTIVSMGPMLEDPDTRPSGLESALEPVVACPHPSALPVTDLRFEELPGDASFVDASPAGNDAVVTAGASGPTAGYPGAGDAELSDHAIRFDDPTDSVTLGNPVDDAVSLAFWYRTDPGGAGQPLRIGAGGPSGYELSITPDGEVGWTVGGMTTGGPVAGLDDGLWHFVSATRDRSGRIAVHVDGVESSSGPTSPAPAAAADLVIVGGDGTVELDHLRIYRTGLGADVVQALFARTASAFCVTAGHTSASGGTSQYPWARLTFDEIDPRGGRLDASDQLRLTVDADLPSSTIVAPTTVVRGGAQTLVLGGSASDPTSDITLVEVRVDGGDWVPATGTESWSFPLGIVDGAYEVQSRATDSVGNVEAPGPPVLVVADGVAPTVTLDAVPDLPVQPDPDPRDGGSMLTLTGTVVDDGSGVAEDGVQVQLLPEGSGPLERGWQAASVAGDTWTISYRFGSGPADLSGTYDIRVRATDRSGNATPADAAAGVIRLDNAAPDATLSPVDTVRESLTGTTTIGGSVTDAGGSGIDTVEIAFTSLQTLATEHTPGWMPVTLTDAGSGVDRTDWSMTVPPGLENFFQVDLRTTDRAGNSQEIRNLWRGVIDNQAPFVTLEAVPTGRTSRGGTRHEVQYRCVATDLFLSEPDVDCPGRELQPPARTFAQDPLLQAEFPDQVLLTGLESQFSRWERADAPVVAMTACDRFDNCASIDTNDEQRAAVSRADAPVAVTVVAPRPGEHVAVDGQVGIHVSADVAGDGDSLRTVTVIVDGAEVAERGYSPGARRTLDILLEVPVAAGAHTVEVRVVSWDDQSASAQPVDFVADVDPPEVALSTTDISAGDTWGVGTDVVRLAGTVTDDGQIVAVQVDVDGQEWTEAIVDPAAGTWRAAVFVPDADGRDVPVSVRGIDRAGRMTTVLGSADVALAPPGYERPTTTMTDGPPASTTLPGGTFHFTGAAGDTELSGFTCRLDDQPAVPCASPWTVAGVSAGVHTVAVVAVDVEGLTDLTPATHTWTVEPNGPTVTLVEVPDDPTDQRTARFAFTAAPGVTTECALDDGPYEPCTSPVAHVVALGAHRLAIRATEGAVTGTAVAHRWSVVNLAPVAVDLEVVVRPADRAGHPLRLEATDVDDLTFRIVERPTGGFLEGSGAELTYVPFDDFVGLDDFTFVADDGQHVSNIAHVRVNVRPESSGPSQPDPTPEPTPEPPATLPPGIGEDDPVVTAIAISRERFPAATRQAEGQADHVVLSRDDAFADSLAASVLTAGGPLLFTASGSLDERTETEIGRVLAPSGTVVLLGGTAALSRTV